MPKLISKVKNIFEIIFMRLHYNSEILFDQKLIAYNIVKTITKKTVLFTLSTTLLVLSLMSKIYILIFL